jgi:hypothetical protein
LLALESRHAGRAELCDRRLAVVQIGVGAGAEHHRAGLLGEQRDVPGRHVHRVYARRPIEDAERVEVGDRRHARRLKAVGQALGLLSERTRAALDELDLARGL